MLGALGASLAATNGSWLGPLIYFVGINIIRILMRWYGLRWGYERGTDMVAEVGGGQLKKITQMAAIMGLFVMGALVSQWTKIYFPLVVSKVANFSIDLPEASVAVQVSGTFGSRQEEAQRLGRLLRPKHDGGTAHFYSVVSRDTLDADYAAHRQRFLAEQGYAYRIVDESDI